MDEQRPNPPLKREGEGELLETFGSSNSPNPSLQEGNPDVMRQVVEAVLDEVRPALASHGGDAELAKIEGKSVTIALKGSCHGCPMSVMTFGLMVDDMIKRRLPEVEVYYE